MTYAKAPIIEAVLEFVFSNETAQSVIESAARRVETAYSQKDIEETAEFQFDRSRKAESVPAKWTWLGLKLSSPDRADILDFRKDRFVCIRLAPYSSWDVFRAKATDGWAAWRKSAGSLEIKRIGLRYINRIDIPNPDNALIQIEEYLTILPRAPAILTEAMTAYTVQASRPLGSDQCTVTLTSSSVASPLVGYASFALDIDVYRSENIPRREDALWDLVDLMRGHKNRIFEACITDKTRALFQ